MSVLHQMVYLVQAAGLIGVSALFGHLACIEFFGDYRDRVSGVLLGLMGASTLVFAVSVAMMGIK